MSLPTKKQRQPKEVDDSFFESQPAVVDDSFFGDTAEPVKKKDQLPFGIGSGQSTPVFKRELPPDFYGSGLSATQPAANTAPAADDLAGSGSPLADIALPDQQIDNTPTVAGRLVTGINQAATPTVVTETPEQKKARYDTIANSSADEIYTSYQNKVDTAVKGVDFTNPISVVDHVMDLSLLDQSREGKAANIISSISKGSANMDDLQYLSRVAPKALKGIIAPVVPPETFELNDATMQKFLAENNAAIAEKTKADNALFYSQESNVINQKLSSIGVDTMQVGNKDYLQGIVEQNKKNEAAEKDALNKLYPNVINKIDSPYEFTEDNEYREWVAKNAEIDKKYQTLNYYLGKSYGNAYAKANPTKTSKEIGEQILQFADPDLYAMGQQAKGDYGAQNRTVAKLGIESLYSTGDAGAVSLAHDDESYLDKDHPEQIIAETYHRLGAELYKSENGFFNASPSMKEIDAAAKNLPQANMDVYIKYIRPKEAAMLGTDIPMAGFINKLGEGFSTAATNLVKGIGDKIGARSKEDIAKEALNENTSYADVGEFSVSKQRLAELNNKLKTSEPLSVDELNEKREIEKYTNVRSRFQEIIDGTGNLTGQVLFQAMGTKLLSSALVAGTGGVGLLKDAATATDVAGEAGFTTALPGQIFSISKPALTELSAIGLMYGQSIDDGKKKALQLFPDDADAGKRGLYSEIFAGVMALSSRVFKDEKVLDAFKQDATPAIANLVTNISEGKVAREALGPSISDIVRSGVKFVGETLKQDVKVAGEMAIINIGQSTATAILAPSKFNFNDAYNEALNAFTTTFLNGGVVAGFAAVGGIKSNRMAMPLVTRLGTDVDFTKAVHLEINRQEQQKIITPEEAYMKRQIVETAQVINTKNIPQIMADHDLNENERTKYAAQLLNESLLKRRLENTDDGVLEESLNNKIKQSEIIRKGILEKKLFVTDDYGVQTEAEANADARKDVEQPADNPALTEALGLLDAHKKNLNEIDRHTAEVMLDRLVKYIADQSIGRMEDGTFHDAGGNRTAMEKIYTPELVAKAIEAYPGPAETPGSETIPDKTSTPVEPEIKEGVVYHPHPDRDFSDLGPVTVESVKDGVVNVKLDDGTDYGFGQKDFIQQFQEQPKEDAVVNPLSDVESTTKALDEFASTGGDFKSLADLVPDFTDKHFKGANKTATEIISELYHTAKTDGSNPELVKAVEDAVVSKQPEAANLSLGDKARNAAANIRANGILPDFLKADLPEGTQLKGTSINEVFARALEIFADVHDKAKDVAHAIAEAFKHIKEHFINNNIPFDEEKVRGQFDNYVRLSLEQKPVRDQNESKAEFATRVMEWRKRMLDTGTAEQQAHALKNSQAELEFIKKVNEGTELLAKDMSITREDFNKQLGIPAGDYDTYVSTLKYMKSSNKEAAKLLNSLRASDPKKVAATEVSLIRKQLMDFQRGFTAGKKESKEQIVAIKDAISQMLHDYNEQGLLDGVKYDPKDLLTLASKVNNVLTEASFDQLNNFMQNLIDKAEYGRFLLRSTELSKQIKKVIKSKTVSQNDIPVLKELANLNPVLLQNIGTYMDMLEDVEKTRTVKEVDRKYSNAEIKEFTEAAKQNEVDVKATNIIDRFENLINSQAYKQAVNDGQIPPSVEGWARKNVNDILLDNTTSLEEKKKALNDVSSVVNVFARSLFNKEATTPEAIQQGIADQSATADEGIRTQLEDLAKAQQETIDLIDEENLTDEQKKALDILKTVGLTGRDSKTLKLFSNVLNNVITNGDNSGVGVFEVIKKGQDNAKPLLQYLKETGRKLLDRSLKTKLGKLRFLTMNKSVIITALTNNNAEVSTKLDNAVSLNDMTVGFAKVNHEYHDNITTPLRKIMTEHPKLHDDPDSIVRLSLFSFLNQSVKDSTVLEKDAQLQRRIGIIRDDIALKTKEGTEPDRNEAVREQKILDEFRQRILDTTGKDIYDEQALASLTKEEFDKQEIPTDDQNVISFLSEGERKVYDLFRDYQEKLQPEHQETVNYLLNKKYEAWDNYMKDSYRQLGSGLVNVELADDAKLGFTATEKGMDAASGATIDRTKGDPLAQKSGDPQRVLNLHFYNAQEQGVRGVLEDVHTLAERMAADEGFLNPELKQELGNDNHALLKKSVTNYVKNEMGVGSSGESQLGLRIIKKGLDTVSTLGVRRQLLSLSAFLKQYTDTLIKTPFNLGKDYMMFFQANSLRNNEDAMGLIKQNGISHRKENLAGLNIISNEQLSNKNNLVDDPEHKSILKSGMDAAGNMIDRFVNHINKGGVESEPFIAKPIKYGDYMPAVNAWLAYYGQWLVNHGKADSFETIDWSKENQSQDREASAYAEQMTSKKLNENTKGGRSELINNPSLALNVFKNIFFPFGSFNMHNWNVMVEDVRTLANKQMIIDENYRKDEGLTAAKSLMSSIVGETIFQGVKQSVRFAITKYVLTGLVELYAQMFTSDDDKETISKLREYVAKAQENEEAHGVERWYSETIGNLFFGGFGNTPQYAAEDAINAATNSDFFYHSKETVNQQLENEGNFGMIGAAFSGMGKLTKDAYRVLFNPQNREGQDVHITNAEKGAIAAAFLSEFLTMSGRGDADLNRTIEKVRGYVDRELDKKYKDPDYEDMVDFFDRPKKITQGGNDFKLTPEQTDYVVEQRSARLNQLENSSLTDKQKLKMANEWAQAALKVKYGAELYKQPLPKKK